jgi:hypothetical protein
VCAPPSATRSLAPPAEVANLARSTGT